MALTENQIIMTREMIEAALGDTILGYIVEDIEQEGIQQDIFEHLKNNAIDFKKIYEELPQFDRVFANEKGEIQLNKFMENKDEIQKQFKEYIANLQEGSTLILTCNISNLQSLIQTLIEQSKKEYGLNDTVELLTTLSTTMYKLNKEFFVSKFKLEPSDTLKRSIDTIICFLNISEIIIDEFKDRSPNYKINRHLLMGMLTFEVKEIKSQIDKNKKSNLSELERVRSDYSNAFFPSEKKNEDAVKSDSEVCKLTQNKNVPIEKFLALTDLYDNAKTFLEKASITEKRKLNEILTVTDVKDTITTCLDKYRKPVEIQDDGMDIHEQHTRFQK